MNLSTQYMVLLRAPCCLGVLMVCLGQVPAQSAEQRILDDKLYKDDYSVPHSIVSSDGRWAVRRESRTLGDQVPGDRLVLVNTHSGTSRVIYETVPSGDQSLVDAIDSLAFSPGNKEIMFIVSGGTWYYPRDVMTIEVDGTELRQLTNATPMKWLEKDGEYAVDSAQYSPDGAHILLDINIATSGSTDNGETTLAVAIIRPNVEKQSTSALVYGRAMYWSVDSKSFYYEAIDGTAKRYYPNNNVTVDIRAPHRPILGRVLNRDAVFVETDAGKISIDSLDASAVDPRLLAAAAAIPLRDSAGRKLMSISTLDNSKAVLTYGPTPLDPRIHRQKIPFP